MSDLTFLTSQMIAAVMAVVELTPGGQCRVEREAPQEAQCFDQCWHTGGMPFLWDRQKERNLKRGLRELKSWVKTWGVSHQTGREGRPWRKK